jgi:hypothetical protein
MNAGHLMPGASMHELPGTSPDVAAWIREAA